MLGGSRGLVLWVRWLGGGWSLVGILGGRFLKGGSGEEGKFF